MIVGIDLGTTNSLIGAFVDGAPLLFPNASGSLLTPSAISLDEDGNVLVGAAARDRLLTHPDLSVAHFKRWMGTAREVNLKGRHLRAEQLSALVLKSLIADARAVTGTEITEAVISVPAYFSDTQREATRVAGELAGLKVERLINEPTAAALAYGLQDRGEDGRFLVFDLGGGTLDVSVIEIFDGIVQVHATAGDNFLGGEDFLDALVGAALKDLAVDADELDASEKAQLRRKMERIKVALTGSGQAGMELSLAGAIRTWSVTDDRFIEIVEPLTQRLRAPLERALRDAKINPGQLDEVVLVGGASRMPLVARTLSRLLGRLPLRHVNPDEAIARGAAVAAGLKARDAQLEEVVLTDVCPYTLGIDTSRRDASGRLTDGYFMPIINRSSAVPISREKMVYPVHERQTKIVCIVYQGENPIADRNVRLGSIDIPVPTAAEGKHRGVNVRFTYDINGILQVELTAAATGERRELILEQSPGRLTPAEIRERLAELIVLKVHPRDKQENLAVIARAERLYEELIDERERLMEMILQFRLVLDGQDEGTIKRARSDISEILDRLEAF